MLRVIRVSAGIWRGNCSLPLDIWSPVACFWASLKTLVSLGSDKVWSNKTMMFTSSQRPKSCGSMCLYICLGHLYSFPGLPWVVLILRGRRAYGPGLVWISLWFQLRMYSGWLLWLEFSGFNQGTYLGWLLWRECSRVWGKFWIYGKRSTRRLRSHER